MKTIAFRSLAIAILVLSTTGFASASYTYNVSASLQYGGTLTGTITFASSASLNTVTGFDLVASASPGSPGFTFPGFEYTSVNSTVTAETSTLIQFDSTTGGNELRLTFAAPLTASGATLTTGGYESELVAGNRSTVSGSVSPAAVPEPSSLALCGIAGIAGLALARMRRGRSA